MLDIGWWELLVVGLVALVVVGPKELPALLRTIGRYVGMAKRQADEFRSQFDEALRESEFNELRKEMDDLKSGVTSSLDEAQKSINSDFDDDADEYDWDKDGPIEPAAEFASDEPTTSFTMPDGEVVKKREGGEVVEKRNESESAAASDVATTAAASPPTDPADPPTPAEGSLDGVTETAANDQASPAEADPKPTRDAEAVR